MARKTRKTSTTKAKKKRTAVTRKKRKAAGKRKTTRRSKARKSVLAEIAGGFGAVIDTFSEAQRLRRKLEPGMADGE
jgi:hypothetical protein